MTTVKKNFADGIRDHAADSPRTRGRWTYFLKHRWPASVGIAVAVLTAFDLRIDVESISFLSALVVVMPLVYVGAAVVDRRRFAWVVLLVAIAALVLAQVLDSKVNLVLVFLVVALAFLVVGVTRGQLRLPGGIPLQTAGMLAFGATALVAFYADPVLGGYLVALALLGHAAWDAYHYLRNRVVPRSYAEFCAVLDLLLGAAILLMT